METIVDIISKQVADDIANQLDKVIIEGLKRKGYEFASKYHLGEFIKEYGEAQTIEGSNTTVYLVKGEPFLEFTRSERSLDFNPSTTTYSVDYGEYRYL